MEFRSGRTGRRTAMAIRRRRAFSTRAAAGACALGMLCGIPINAIAADVVAGDKLEEVIVSARRQSESVMKVPESITAFDSAALEKLNVQGFNDYATKVPNMSFQYGGSGGGGGAALGVGGARAVAIRGISGAGTTGVYIDDTPIPATIDPQVVDLERIEVLKGPQGTLYGAGSMGGNIRMITRVPKMESEFKYTAQAGFTQDAGSPDGRMELVGNAPLTDSSAVRIMGFFDHDGGFIKRTYPTGSGGQYETIGNQGALTSYGASVTGLFKLGGAISITPRIVAQTADSKGWNVAYAPLPGFEIQSLNQVRAANVEESYNDKWYLPSVQVEYAGSRWDLIFSSSYFHRRLYNLEDGTEGTAAALAGPPYNAPASVFTNGVPWPQLATNSNVYDELRASWAGHEHVHAIVGAYYSNQVQRWQNGSLDFTFPDLVTTGTWNTSLLWDQHINTGIVDRALYGEIYLKGGGLELTVGGRHFWLDESFQNSVNGFVNYSGYTLNDPQKTSESGFTPKVSLSYTVPGGALVYGAASKGYRAGGPNNPVTPACDLTPLGVTADQLKSYHADSLWNYEVGVKGHAGGFGLTAAVFQMNWDQIQQNIAIPVCFLPMTANAGAARIRGAEFEAVGHLSRELDIRVGLGYQDPRITRLGLTGQAVGSRIYGVPFVTGSAVLTYTHALSETLNGVASLDFSYTGDSVSSTTTSLYGQPPAVRAGFGLLNAHIGGQWGKKRLALVVKNITNVRANLGDENPIAYPAVDAAGAVIPRVVVLRPFQVAIEFRYGL